ncbi:hypothetical protein CAEBREN_09439 [Caenorhabditis brenneri]|uniref:Uncharacterized protein n=1 Tax=Caenorhabditis brenneri TaxID=135651 RepID=G0NCK7_CAEBE|nr:hypothetical protein CAEBREN_09439 [Caenorhabditis brenneri]
MSNFDPGLDTFPLFQTPSLVWEMVILRMGLLEIFTLSFCSKNIYNAVQPVDLLISKPNVKLEPLFERLRTVKILWFEVDRTLPVTVPIGLTWEHEELVLDNAHWLTVPHLLLMNCKRLIIHNCLLQDFDINLYLRHFVNGAVPLVEHLTIEAVRQDMMEVLEDIECEENPNRVLKTSPDDIRAMLITPMDIRQNGETIATVFYTQETSFSISTYFLDVVKPSHICVGPVDNGVSRYMI